MARPDPYIQKNPGDIIYAGDWNDIQVQVREHIGAHDHTGGAVGPQIGRAGIQPGAIDGSLIDPAAAVTVQDVTVTGALKVDGTAMLGDIDDLLAHVKGLASGKVDRSGDTITGSLQIGETLSVAGQIRAGEAAGSQDPNVVLHGHSSRSVYGVLEAPSNAYWAADCQNVGSGLIMRQGGADKAFAYWSVSNQSFSIDESGATRFVIKGGSVGIGTSKPDTTYKLQVSGELGATDITLPKGGRWRGRYGGDAAIVNDGGGYEALMIVGADYNKGKKRWVRLWDTLTVDEGIEYGGQLSKLDVEDQHTANARCQDFRIGSSRRSGKRVGTHGRALVDYGSELHLNYGNDWPRGVRHWGTISAASSRSIKEDITDLGLAEAADVLDRLRAVKFRFKPDHGGQPAVGFIAEDVPDMVGTPGRDGVVTAHIVAVLVEVVKDQQRRIAALDERLQHVPARP
jgi:hypothetical protein